METLFTVVLGLFTIFVMLCGPATGARAVLGLTFRETEKSSVIIASLYFIGSIGTIFALCLFEQQLLKLALVVLAVHLLPVFIYWVIGKLWNKGNLVCGIFFLFLIIVSAYRVTLFNALTAPSREGESTVVYLPLD